MIRIRIRIQKAFKPIVERHAIHVKRGRGFRRYEGRKYFFVFMLHSNFRLGLQKQRFCWHFYKIKHILILSCAYTDHKWPLRNFCYRNIRSVQISSKIIFLSFVNLRPFLHSDSEKNCSFSLVFSQPQKSENPILALLMVNINMLGEKTQWTVGHFCQCVVALWTHGNILSLQTLYILLFLHMKVKKGL